MNPDNSIIIQTRDLRFAYNHQAVINGVDLTVPVGSIFGFLGPNGAGKSTTIKVLLGLLQVQEGMVQLFGQELTRNKMKILSRTGAMVESPSLYDHLSAYRNLEITQRLSRLPSYRIREVLEIVSLTGDAHRPVKQFSTGMKQRLSLALALLGEPELLILDEPINGLDPSGIREIRNLLNLLNREQGCTIFLSSHILGEIEKICSHVAVINKGRILYQGDTSGLLKRYNQKDRLVLQTGNNLDAASILAGKGAFVEGNFVSVPYRTKADIAEMIRLIAGAGIDIYSAERDHNDLESSFLEILQEGGEK
jgi:ABC-type multidrug transport system ATPase subunit